jgi:hypothetical protein
MRETGEDASLASDGDETGLTASLSVSLALVAVAVAVVVADELVAVTVVVADELVAVALVVGDGPRACDAPLVGRGSATCASDSSVCVFFHASAKMWCWFWCWCCVFF